MRSRWTSAGAIGAALLASSCCLGPLLLGALGLGTIGAAGALERFRPYLIVLTLVVLGLAFYRAYRRQPESCEGGACAIRAASRWSRIGLWIVAITVVAILSFPMWSPILFRSDASSDAKAHVLKFSVEGMTCGGCAVTVQQALREVPGVNDAVVDFDSSSATVFTSASTPEIQSLVEAVRRAGYGLSPVSVTGIQEAR